MDRSVNERGITPSLLRRAAGEARLRHLASGLYYYRLVAAGYEKTLKMMVVK